MTRQSRWRALSDFNELRIFMAGRLPRSRKCLFLRKVRGPAAHLESGAVQVKALRLLRADRLARPLEQPALPRERVADDAVDVRVSRTPVEHLEHPFVARDEL